MKMRQRLVLRDTGWVILVREFDDNGNIIREYEVIP